MTRLLVLIGGLLALALPAIAQTPPGIPRPTLPKLGGTLAGPRVVSFRVTDGPYLRPSTSRGKDTKIEIELADFEPPAGALMQPSLWAGACSTSGLFATSTPGGSPYKLRWDYSFSGVENSGKTCAMELRFNGGTGLRLAAGTLTLPTLQTYTISTTADLLNLTTSSGVRVSASATKNNLILPCELASVGTAGTFATGVVNEGGDLTFQLRNGLLQENCVFATNNPLLVKADWSVKAATWQFTTDANCSDGNARFAIQASSGQTVTFFFDETAIFKVRFEVSCRPDSTDLPRNNHLYKARLAEVQLVGPAGQRWQDAFK